MKNLGPQSASDNVFTKICRQLQSEYRVETLNEEKFGIGPSENSKSPHGNMLVDGYKTGSNFVSKCAFKYAKQRVIDKAICPELTIDEYRLFNNMLSSMPLCFNLFSDLRRILVKDKKECSAIVKALFQEIKWIETVEYIGVEFIPTPTREYTDDKSAFDAIIIVKDKNGKKGLISIETKYTDGLGSNSSSKTSLKDDLVSKEKIFSQELVQQIKKDGYSQLLRNYLLTYSYKKKNGFQLFANIIISPREDVDSEKEIEALKANLERDKETVFKIPLEEFLNRGKGLANGELSGIYKKIYERYIPKT
jgi:hypothetical protein